MFFSKLLPHDGNFFEQINQHANCILQAAQALSQLVTHYADPAQRQQYTQQVIDAEDRADAITHAVNTMLHKTFITPIDREDILRINRVQSEAIALVYNLANRLYIFEFSVIRFPMIQLARILKDMTMLTEAMLEGLSKKRDSHNSRMFRALRADCEMILSMAIVELYDLEEPTVPDIMGILKWSQAYDRAEIALAQVTKLAETIEEAVLKHV